jgi:(p)ppGpp synthase/HD superfamily hydrolase
VRKGTNIPYFAHLLAVTAIVLEFGGDEDLAIAALLHDSVEDQGGLPVLDKIRERFGQRVAKIVEGCTDSFTTPKPPWRQRKEDYLQHLRSASLDIKRVSLADKVHNARSILLDLRVSGAKVWKRFHGGKQGTLWYYHSLLEVFRENNFSPLVDEFERVITEIDELTSK